MGSAFSGMAARAAELGTRLHDERFRLAVLGQFKRGKSSLLNALIGEALLPTGVLPLTAIPTILRYGATPRVRVAWLGGRSEAYSGPIDVLTKVLSRYVTERENPGNHFGVMQVDVDYPSPLLGAGLEIIDTPGIGSTILENTRTARNVLPVCDGALFILSPDPPITEVEIQFLRAVKEAATRVTFVVTKADTLTPTDRPEMLGFLREILCREVGFTNQEPLFLVSAQQALAGRLADDTDLRPQSGIDELETYLMNFVKTDKRTALQEAIGKKAARLIRETLFTLDIQRKAIELPRQDLERRLERFEAHLATIERERVYFRDRLDGDRRRTADEVDQFTEGLAGKVREALSTRARSMLGADHERLCAFDPSRIGAAFSEEIDRIFSGAAGDLWVRATARFGDVQDIHCRDIEGLIDRVRRTAADLFEVPYLESTDLGKLEAIKEPRVIQQRWVTSFTEEAGSWITKVLPRALRLKRLERRLQEDMNYLVNRNVEELRWATRQNLEEAFRAFQGRMEAQVEATISAIRASVQTALEQQAQREARLAPESDRLDGLRQRLIQFLTLLAPQESSAVEGKPL